MTMDPGAVYRVEAAGSENKLRLVVVLYEQMVRDLAQAEAAIAARDIERRTTAINHALQILAQLQGRLDFANGGEVARNLDRFYHQARARLEEAHFQASAEIIREQISLLLTLRDAWAEVEQQQSGAGQAGATTGNAPPSPAERAPSNWRA